MWSSSAVARVRSRAASHPWACGRWNRSLRTDDRPCPRGGGRPSARDHLPRRLVQRQDGTARRRIRRRDRRHGPHGRTGPSRRHARGCSPAASWRVRGVQRPASRLRPAGSTWQRDGDGRAVALAVSRSFDRAPVTERWRFAARPSCEGTQPFDASRVPRTLATASMPSPTLASRSCVSTSLGRHRMSAPARRASHVGGTMPPSSCSFRPSVPRREDGNRARLSVWRRSEPSSAGPSPRPGRPCPPPAPGSGSIPGSRAGRSRWRSACSGSCPGCGDA